MVHVVIVRITPPRGRVYDFSKLAAVQLKLPSQLTPANFPKSWPRPRGGVLIYAVIQAISQHSLVSREP